MLNVTKREESCRVCSLTRWFIFNKEIKCTRDISAVWEIKKRCPDIRKYAVVSIPQKYLYTVPTLWCEAQHHKPQRLC